MLELGTLGFQLAKLHLALLQCTMIATPGKDSVGSGDCVTSEGPDNNQRHAGIAARRIISKIGFPPRITVKKNHERRAKASEKNALVDKAGIKLGMFAGANRLCVELTLADRP